MVIAKIQFGDVLASVQYSSQLGERHFGIAYGQLLHIPHLQYLVSNLFSRKPITAVGTEIGYQFGGDELGEEFIPQTGSEKVGPRADGHYPEII